jgi:HPt (histidine-containing phosphotransfer) domain-containing protein
MPVEFSRIDMAAALQAVNGDQDLLKQIFAAFLEECPILVKNIDTSLSKGDAKACQMAAHTLKGAVRTFGAENASRLAAEVEAAGKAGSISTAQGLWPELAKEIEAIRIELANCK